MRSLFVVTLCALAMASCKVKEDAVAGTYRLKNTPRTVLVLNKDKTFEFVKNFSQPGPVFFPDSTELNFRTAGSWKLESNNQIILNSFAGKNDKRGINEEQSITPNQSITSFSFWDRYGDPVPIRYMKFPTDKIKFYRANTISFFVDDFSSKDTLEFHFYGYNPVKWPGHFSAGIKGNNNYNITLYEEDREGCFNNVVLSAGKKKLVSPDRSVTLYKTQ